MKKINLLISSVLILMLLFCGCISNRIDEDKATERLANQIFECLNNKDAEGLKSLFSKYVAETYDLDKEIEGLFEFFDGKIVTYDNFDSGAGSETIHDGKQVFLTISPVIKNVKTDTGKVYVIRFSAFIVNEDDEDRVGINGLKIIIDEETEYVVGDW